MFDQAHYHLTEGEVREHTIHPTDHQAAVVFFFFLTKTHAESDAWKGLTGLKKTEGSQGQKKKKEHRRNTSASAISPALHMPYL